MTAGRGIAHSERRHKDDRARPQTMHGLQFWVALPDERELAENDLTRALRGLPEHRSDAELPELTSEQAETPHGNVLELLGRGVEKADEMDGSTEICWPVVRGFPLALAQLPQTVPVALPSPLTMTCNCDTTTAAVLPS